MEELELNPRTLSTASYQRGWPWAIEEARYLLGFRGLEHPCPELIRGKQRLPSLPLEAFLR